MDGAGVGVGGGGGGTGDGGADSGSGLSVGSVTVVDGGGVESGSNGVGSGGGGGGGEISVEGKEVIEVCAEGVTSPVANSQIQQLLAKGRRPFDVTLKGGNPWGFALDGGDGTDSPLHISKIVSDGKASESALMEGDYVLAVNSLACSDVGQALDIVDTALTILTITVLRGQWESPSQGLKPQSYLQRAYDLQRKERSTGARTRDDSSVYTQSRSSLSQPGGMRPSKRRGDSFNVGKLSTVSADRKPSSPLRHPPQPSDPPWPSHETRWSFDNNVSSGQQQQHQHQQHHHDKVRSAGHSHSHHSSHHHHQPDLAANMSRRRSEGHNLLSSSSSSFSPLPLPLLPPPPPPLPVYCVGVGHHVRK
ncbi:LIM domain-binding protein 3 [Aplysia californica]|uniref:LIM domain-binding protein 3 n=1 Tax=Aplysia californica TaxID=6500 RepID=A0ABM0KA13_APLCA|nr:LIM domain-binding protein 3 [Aplysia californica]